MTYSGLEMAAILKMAQVMANADGKVTNDETAIILAEMANFGAISKSDGLVLAAKAMSASDALMVLKGMNTIQKKYVCGFLAAISAVDGIDAKEIAVWQLTSTLAQFPTMTINEALDFWSNH